MRINHSTPKKELISMKELAQTVLSFKLEETENDSSLTSHAGLPLIHELFRKLKLPRLINKHLKLKQKGWKEWELIETIVALVISGGEHMEDVDILQADIALQQLLKQRKGLPSKKAIERFLKRFHDEQTRPDGDAAWVPEESAALKALGTISQAVAKRLIQLKGLQSVTIEDDATVVESRKQQAEGTYKGGSGYQPVLGAVAELGIVVSDEFRDGNVPAKYDALNSFKKCLRGLPKCVKHVDTRLDGAYYQHNLIGYLKENQIPFTITADKSQSLVEWIQALSDEQWKPLAGTDREWTEFEWSAAVSTRSDMKEQTLRYLITRKTHEQWELFQEEFSSPITAKDRYEAIVTNRKESGDYLIRWHYGKAGSIEHIHDRIKNDLAGGVLPCAEFGANAAWWRLQCLAYNLVRCLQLFGLPDQLQWCHLKRLRHRLFCIAGKVVAHSRYRILKLSRGHPSFSIYQEARYQIAALGVP
jgi:hypothetical protein